MSLEDKLLVGYSSLVLIAALGFVSLVLLPDWLRQRRAARNSGAQWWPR